MNRKILCTVLSILAVLSFMGAGVFANENIYSADYTIERIDTSLYDASGKLIYERYYDKVTVLGESEAIKKINQQIQADYDEYLRFHSDGEEFAREHTSTFGRAKNFVKAEVVTNTAGILSIKRTVGYYMGGMHDVDGYGGLNFNLQTGEKLSAPEALRKSKGEAEKYLKEKTISYLRADGQNWGSGAEDLVNGYTSEYFDFYIQNDALFLCFPPAALGPKYFGAVVVECPIEEIEVTLDGKRIYFDRTPIMVNNRVLVPIRAIFEAMGYNVTWNAETQTAYADHGTRSIAITVGNKIIDTPYKKYESDVAPVNLEGRILVPVRAVAELSGYDVSWNQSDLVVEIKKYKY